MIRSNVIVGVAHCIDRRATGGASSISVEDGCLRIAYQDEPEWTYKINPNEGKVELVTVDVDDVDETAVSAAASSLSLASPPSATSSSMKASITESPPLTGKRKARSSPTKPRPKRNKSNWEAV